MRACPHCLSVYSVDAEHCSVDGEKLGGPAILRGRTIEGYVFEDLLGLGGTGCVYRGRLESGTPCAIKLLFREMANDESLIERFRREAEAVSAMDHPNVVRIFGYGTTDAGTVYIAMEYLEGKTLKETLDLESPLTPLRAGRIAEMMASGLGEAHRLGFVHRDLKPGNIMLCRDRSGREQVKLLDFGIVASIKERDADSRLTKTGYIVGTPTYMAPEQIDPKLVGPQVDVYALGVMLYEMLCGQPPFRGSLEQILVAKMTEDPTPIEEGGELGKLALRFLEKDLEKRPRSALQAKAMLSRLSLLSDEDPPTEMGDQPILPAYAEVGGSAPTVRYQDWDSEVTLTPELKRDQRHQFGNRGTTDTRRINFEWPPDELRPAISSEVDSADLLHPAARPDTLVDERPAAMDHLPPSDPSILPVPSDSTEADVDAPTQIAPPPERATDALFRDTDEDMPIPRVEEESVDEELIDDQRPSLSPDEEPTAGEEETALQIMVDPPVYVPAITKAVPPPEPAVRPFPLGRMIALSLLVLSLAAVATLIALDFFSTETVIIDVPRE